MPRWSTRRSRPPGACWPTTPSASRREPMTASEDFARFLEHVPGCFVFLGNGNSAPLHNPAYDFNDEGLLHGARFHAAIVRQRLARI